MGEEPGVERGPKGLGVSDLTVHIVGPVGTVSRAQVSALAQAGASEVGPRLAPVPTGEGNGGQATATGLDGPVRGPVRQGLPRPPPRPIVVGETRPVCLEGGVVEPGAGRGAPTGVAVQETGPEVGLALGRPLPPVRLAVSDWVLGGRSRVGSVAPPPTPSIFGHTPSPGLAPPAHRGYEREGTRGRDRLGWVSVTRGKDPDPRGRPRSKGGR